MYMIYITCISHTHTHTPHTSSTNLTVAPVSSTTRTVLAPSTAHIHNTSALMSSISAASSSAVASEEPSSGQQATDPNIYYADFAFTSLPNVVSEVIEHVPSFRQIHNFEGIEDVASLSDRNKFEMLGVKGIVREIDGAGIGLVDTRACDLKAVSCDGASGSEDLEARIAGIRHLEAKLQGGANGENSPKPFSTYCSFGFINMTSCIDTA